MGFKQLQFDHCAAFREEFAPRPQDQRVDEQHVAVNQGASLVLWMTGLRMALLLAGKR